MNFLNLGMEGLIERHVSAQISPRLVLSCRLAEMPSWCPSSTVWPVSSVASSSSACSALWPTPRAKMFPASSHQVCREARVLLKLWKNKTIAGFDCTWTVRRSSPACAWVGLGERRETIMYPKLSRDSKILSLPVTSKLWALQIRLLGVLLRDHSYSQRNKLETVGMYPPYRGIRLERVDGKLTFSRRSRIGLRGLPRGHSADAPVSAVGGVFLLHAVCTRTGESGEGRINVSHCYFKREFVDILRVNCFRFNDGGMKQLFSQKD